ncbi:hypothetical protein K2O51_31130 (plasmid) [Cupriavidus pinatubonensis]|uniref:hypothetical protein n=1 Tax=Cupriavidus pinatubonensis TaxID=248026 RepID=UPI001C7320BC|nr:hypothetical protein [Cupriavidus pinatubonensis]QYY33700.1 hypothetical protein K2O51_31130 [Cupriavidus pinatubonensis]
MNRIMMGKLVAIAVLALASNLASAQEQDSGKAGSKVTVVTLYSEAWVAPGMGGGDQSSRPPIQIVNGGVKSAGGSCWELSPTGEIKTVPGECYVLRSAGPGEKPPQQ